MCQGPAPVGGCFFALIRYVQSRGPQAARLCSKLLAEVCSVSPPAMQRRQQGARWRWAARAPHTLLLAKRVSLQHHIPWHVHCLLPGVWIVHLPAAFRGASAPKTQKTQQAPRVGLSQTKFLPPHTHLLFFLLNSSGQFTLVPMSEQLLGIWAWESFIC